MIIGRVVVISAARKKLFLSLSFQYIKPTGISIEEKEVEGKGLLRFLELWMNRTKQENVFT